MSKEVKTIAVTEQEIEKISDKCLMFTIRGKKYFLPDELTLMQWNRAMKAVSESAIDLEKDFDFQNKNLMQSISTIIFKLTDKNLMGKLLSVILVPDGCEYWEEKFESNAKDLSLIGDKTLITILVNFFNGRKDLISTIPSFSEKLGLNKNSL